VDQTAHSQSGEAKKRGRFRVGMIGLVLVVAACDLIVWKGAWIRGHLWEHESLRRIRSENAVERRTAARELGYQHEIDVDETMAALTHALGDKDAGVRTTAAQSLGSLDYQGRLHAGAPVAPALLKKRIDGAMRTLVPLLSDPDPVVRSAAAAGLGSMAMGLRPPPPSRDQLAAMWDGSNAVRRQMAKALYSHPDVPFVPELLAALKDSSAEVRAAAARALMHFGPDLDLAIPILLATMEHDIMDVRRACGQALEAAWPSPAFVPALLESLKSNDRATRYHAAQLLGRIGPEASAAIPTLIAFLNEPLSPSGPDPAVSAARALGQMGPAPEAIAALIEVASAAKIDANLATWAKLPKPTPLQKAGTPAEELRLRLESEFLRIIAAMHGLGHIGPPAIAAVPTLIAAYNKALDRHHLAHAAIPAALGRIAPNSAAAPDAVAALIRGLDAKDITARMGAVDALAHFGKDGAAAIPKLRSLENDPSQVRQASKKSLAALEAQAPSS
jgi:HEAT repeat protein